LSTTHISSFSAQNTFHNFLSRLFIFSLLKYVPGVTLDRLSASHIFLSLKHSLLLSNNKTNSKLKQLTFVIYGQTETHGEAESSIPTTFYSTAKTRSPINSSHQNFRYPACESPTAEQAT